MKKKYIDFIVIGIVIISFIILLIMFLNFSEYNSYSGPLDDEYLDSNGLIDEEMAGKVSWNSYDLASGDLLVEVTNNNKYGADVHIYVYYYDKNNKKVKEEQRFDTINPKSKGYTLFYHNKDNEYDRYEIKLKTEYAYGRVFYNNCIKSKALNKKDFYFYIEYTNICKTSINSVELGVLFYNSKDEIIGYGYTLANKKLRHGKKVKDYVIIPDNGDYGDISYDKYKIVVNEASNW